MNRSVGILILVVLIACPAWTIPCQAGEAENTEIAKSMVEAINERDLDRLDQLIAPDVVRLSAATAGVTVTSIEDFKAMLQADFAVVPDSAMTIDVIFGNGEFVAMRAIYAGTQKGQMGPFPASGKRVELPFVGILRITDGKISQMWVEWDNMHMLTQLGHMPAPTEN